jgi:hypothetical protein
MDARNMKFDGAIIEDLKPLKKFPTAPAGYGDVSYRINNLDLIVSYECIDQDGLQHSGELKFEFFIALSIESETNNKVGLPHDSAVLFCFDSDLRESFKGYQIWFSNNDLATLVCKRVIIGNEVF